jgi:FMN-dependent oxidoreductase (nitrilotriacetate monooxygenase family)
VSAPARQLRLGAFLRGPGHHLAAWRHPDAPASGGMQLAHYRNLAQIAERALFDMIFLADSNAARSSTAALDVFSRTGHIVHLEPLTLLSALAVATEHVGLVATVSTTYNEPYNLARKFASLDHISGGRAGWNMVTSSDANEAANYGLPAHPPHAERYARAHEFLAVTKKLWDSWDDDAFLHDKASGLAFDPAGLHVPHHRGEHFRVRGPLNVARPPQGHPVLVQAGSSEAGQDLAAETAEVVFTAHQRLEDAQAFYRSLKGRLPRHGREPAQLLVMPGIFPVIGRSRAEALERHQVLQELIEPSVGLASLSGLLGGVDTARLPLDEPLPDLPLSDAVKSRFALLTSLAAREQLTVRGLYEAVAGARGHLQVYGTVSDIADEMQAWFEAQAADGFNVMAPYFPGGLEAFTEQVVPELQRRGLFRRAYEGRTLRDNLGLGRPPTPRLKAAAAATHAA